MTHEDLRKRAIRWLASTKRCGVVLSEIVVHADNGEIPDAVGFKHGKSYSVECKVSMSDLWANKKKTHVSADNSVGMFRYFLVPSDLVVSPEDVPGGYGLLSCQVESIRVVRDAPPNEHANILAERDMLVSALRRVRVREFLAILPETDIAEIARESKCKL